jgi:hypothetical protein
MYNLQIVVIYCLLLDQIVPKHQIHFCACRIWFSVYICTPNAKVAQLVEHDLAKVGVASSNLVFRSKPFLQKEGLYF